MDKMQVDSQASPVLFKPTNLLKTITPEPNNNTISNIIKPIAINKLHSISPEPLLKRMRLF